MKIQPTTTIFLSLCTMLMLGCGTAKQGKQLAWHQNMLARNVVQDIDPELKLDTLAISFVSMMSEGLKIMNPKKGLAYVTRYSQENEVIIEQLLQQIGSWQREMNTMEKISFGLRIVQKPYAKDFIDLIGKFEQKYRQVRFISKLSKKVSAGLFDAGLKQIGL